MDTLPVLPPRQRASDGAVRSPAGLVGRARIRRCPICPAIPILVAAGPSSSRPRPIDGAVAIAGPAGRRRTAVRRWPCRAGRGDPCGDLEAGRGLARPRRADRGAWRGRIPPAMAAADAGRRSGSGPPCRRRWRIRWARWRCIGNSTPLPASCSAAAPRRRTSASCWPRPRHAGRGRRGREWLSPPGLNLYLSCLKRFESGFAALSGLSLAIGVIVLRALENLGIAGAGLKWPNDVLAATDGRPGGKLGGILVELSGEYQGPCAAIIGIGLNLRLTSALHEQAGQPACDSGHAGRRHATGSQSRRGGAGRGAGRGAAAVRARWVRRVRRRLRAPRPACAISRCG